jgi:hypothetical protein
MQATHPISTLNHLKAALAAIVVAAVIVSGIVIAALVAPSLAGQDAGAFDTAPLVLDSDARQAPGNRGAIAPTAQ